MPPYSGLGGSESPPPKPRIPLEPHKALLHGILSGQHPGLGGHPAATAHALMTAHRTNVYTTSNTGELMINLICANYDFSTISV